MSDTLPRASQILARVANGCGGLLLVIMLLLTIVDVVGRYFFNAPINGKTELTRILMASLIFLALPVISAKGEQITVDLLDNFYTPRIALWRDCLIHLICSVALFVMTYWLWFRSARLLKRNNVTDFLAIPLYPLAYFITLMTLITAIALFTKALIDLVKK